MNTNKHWEIFNNPEWNLRFREQGYLLIDAIADIDYSNLDKLYNATQAHYQTGFFATILSRDQEHRKLIHENIKEQLARFVNRHFINYRQVICGYAVKQANQESSAMPIHQDISMLEKEQRPGLSLWIPMVDTHKENGYLQILPGSHMLYREYRAPGTPFPARQQEAYIRENMLRAVEIPRGQAIVFDQALFHCSPPNCSGKARPVATSVLIPKEAALRYYHRNTQHDQVMLEEYAVEEDFFLHHQIGTVPVDQTLLRRIPEIQATISIEQLEKLIQPLFK